MRLTKTKSRKSSFWWLYCYRSIFSE